MITLLEDKRLGGAATAILGHKTDHDRVDERERMASVTEQHYNRSQRIGLKAEGMALWVKALLAPYAKEQRKFRDLRSTQLVPPIRPAWPSISAKIEAFGEGETLPTAGLLNPWPVGRSPTRQVEYGARACRATIKVRQSHPDCRAIRAERAIASSLASLPCCGAVACRSAHN